MQCQRLGHTVVDHHTPVIVEHQHILAVDPPGRCTVRAYCEPDISHVLIAMNDSGHAEDDAVELLAKSGSQPEELDIIVLAVQTVPSQRLPVHLCL